jgi:ADP-ribosylation factor family.
MYTYSYFSEPLDTVVPTVGFSSVSLTHRGYVVVIYDLGGGPQIRGIWRRYYVDVCKSLCVQVMNEAEILE